MKNPYEVLQQKEADVARVRHEIESLRIAVSLLGEGSADQQLDAEQQASTEQPHTDGISSTDQNAGSGEEVRPPLEEEETDLPLDARPTGTDCLFSSVGGSRSRVWKIFRREK